MNKYSIAFLSPGNNLLHRIVMAKNEEEALRTFFNEIKLASYTQDDEGFFYFKEDFTFGDRPAGNVIKL
ncbi:MAG: hypothetical protein A2293_00040 [Elusimicrobia bacterium RIFOXYB2_FULL_49_7]|nr:MAG: hypothetical protein A2293_00040 [Elusimicrobia bacterium RIFOXYB2_FULL_49_7]